MAQLYGYRRSRCQFLHYVVVLVVFVVVSVCGLVGSFLCTKYSMHCVYILYMFYKLPLFGSTTFVHMYSSPNGNTNRMCYNTMDISRNWNKKTPNEWTKWEWKNCETSVVCSCCRKEKVLKPIHIYNGKFVCVDTAGKNIVCPQRHYLFYQWSCDALPILLLVHRYTKCVFNVSTFVCWGCRVVSSLTRVILLNRESVYVYVCLWARHFFYFSFIWRMSIVVCWHVHWRQIATGFVLSP